MSDSVKKILAAILVMIIVTPQEGATSYYFISPADVENQTCSQSNRTLTPCYQIGDDLQEALAENEDSLTLLFLPGIHQRAFTAGFLALNAQSKDNVTLIPWDGSLAKIRCQHLLIFTFTDITNLLISSIEFESCTVRIQYPLEPPTKLLSAIILNCSFTSRSRSQYSLAFLSVDNVCIEDCTFRGGSAVWSKRDTTYDDHQWTEFVLRNSSFHHTTRNMDLDEGPEPISSHEDAVGGNDGSALHVEGALLTVSGCWFVGCTAGGSGGACYLTTSSATIEDTTFEGNSATLGGALYLIRTGTTLSHCVFRNNSARRSGGALYSLGVSLQRGLVIEASTTFHSNHAEVSGGAVYSTSEGKYDVKVSNSNFSSNSAKNGGAFHVSESNIEFESWVRVLNNSASERGGAFYVINSFMNYGSCNTCVFSHNRAGSEGGGLFMDASFLVAYNSVHGSVTRFERNAVTSAHGFGGAIFVAEKDCTDPTSPYQQCFVVSRGRVPNKKMLFSNNQASLGSVLYGGGLDRCVPLDSFGYPPSGIEAFKILADYSPTDLAVTSRPKRLCACIDNTTNCNLRFFNFTKQRGERLEVRLAVLDQDGHARSSIIRASYSRVSAFLDKGEGRKLSSDKCETFGYHIITADKDAELRLEPVGPCQESNLMVYITIEPCPQGFEQSADQCICDRRLSDHFNITTCNIDTESAQSKGLVWLRYDKKYLTMSKNCPLLYCQVHTNISFPSPDKQCANQRSGILCGACRDNHSMALGTSACLQCHSSRVWLVVVFAVAGISLVAFLLVCNLTISKGTLNGLIFYANIVSMSGLAYLHRCTIHPILTVFIAWLNLDLGIQTCFYPGMDAYQMTWLQFCFPLYIWLLVIAIIVVSHFSPQATRFFGRSSIAILATLFLLSYNKILKTVSHALAFSDVLVSGAHNVTSPVVSRKVWTLDGNLDYLKGRHIPLFVVSVLILVLFFFPYTLLLIFGQCLRSVSVRGKQLPWTQSAAFVSILDAYHAPYHLQHRYWTGLMLLTRCLLFISFATYQQDRALITNVFSVTLVVMGIFAIRMQTSKIYKHYLVDILDASFLLNLGVLSATLHYLKGKENVDAAMCASVSASISISFISFLGILFWHLCLQIRKREWFLSLRSVTFREAQGEIHSSDHGESFRENSSRTLNVKLLPTSTVVELD